MEPLPGGGRRQRLAGYLKAANELRQTYQQAWTQSREGMSSDDLSGSMPGAFDSGERGIATGDEELVLFPSYAKRHVKRRLPNDGGVQQVPGLGRDVRDGPGLGDAEYWRREWERDTDDRAVVDVDVRGWVFAPHKGPLSRRSRILIGLARQMVGIPAPSDYASSSSGSKASSRASSPRPDSRTRPMDLKEEQALIKEAETLLAKGAPERAGSSPTPSSLSIPDRRASWTSPADMSPEQLAAANLLLMERIKPFLANPLASTPISAFFFNNEQSRQQTIDTDANGHFTIRAALDFVPTHVRVLASEDLSAVQEISLTEPMGVSLISDVDDTVKHSAIGSGAREISRNVFIRELADLSITGVREWYKRLEALGVKFHYVSNSPWQLFPLLSSFFSMAGLPKGSFHLKQYSGMLQGIFEPVAERKKGNLERILRDFPDRKFILVGDSGEADLEVYTDVVCENPGRILGVFIRDITTSVITRQHSWPERDQSRTANDLASVAELQDPRDSVQEDLIDLDWEPPKSASKRAPPVRPPKPHGLAGNAMKRAESDTSVSQASSTIAQPSSRPLDLRGRESGSETVKHIDLEDVPPPLPARSKPGHAAHTAAAAAMGYASSLLQTSPDGDKQPAPVGSDNLGPQWQPNDPLPKKVELWNRRWKRAEMILADDNVHLATWREGQDAIHDSVRLVERALKEREEHAKRRGR